MKQSTKKKTSISTILALSLPLLYLSLLNTSPSNLIKDTAFWFLLSNSIILIVAIDSGVFSTSDDTGINDELIRHDRSYTRPPCFVVEQSKSAENMNVKEKHLNCLEIDKESVKNCLEIDGESVKNEAAAKSFSTEKQATPKGVSDEEESEYWKMSDEELNRRVEEFIRRFNRELSSKK